MQLVTMEECHTGVVEILGFFYLPSLSACGITLAIMIALKNPAA